MLVPRAKPALRPRNKRFLRAEKGMPESFLKRERVRVCVKETSRERRVACASRPPLACYQIRPRLAGVRGTVVRVPWTRDVPSSLTKVAYRKRGTDSRESWSFASSPVASRGIGVGGLQAVKARAPSRRPPRENLMVTAAVGGLLVSSRPLFLPYIVHSMSKKHDAQQGSRSTPVQARFMPRRRRRFDAGRSAAGSSAAPPTNTS